VVTVYMFLFNLTTTTSV